MRAQRVVVTDATQETVQFLTGVSWEDLYPPETWKERSVVMQTTYGDYKTFEGVTLPTRMVASQAGKVVFDVTVLHVEFPPRFDADVFAKPKDP